MNIRISTKGKRPLRSLTPSDKVHAIQRIHDGESKASVARDIGVPESTLRGWCKNEDKLRFMSRQAAAEKFGNDSLSDKLDGSANMLGGPLEKRQRLDSSIGLNFSNKIKFDDLNTYKRAPINGLDFSANKALADLGNFNSISQEYGVFNGSTKKTIYGADISHSAESSMAAVSPLSSLTHLSGLTGLNQSPLAISFNELTTNLTLLAQLNPNIAVMSGINSLNIPSNTLRTNSMKSKLQQQLHSPRVEPTEKQSGLTVKNWAKQTPSTPTSSDSASCGLNLCQNEDKLQIKSPSTNLVSSAQQLGSTIQTLPPIPEDPLLYWLKSQQAVLGLNSIYPQNVLGATSPPVRSSSPQQQNLHTGTSPIIPNTLTPSSTPSGSLDDKNAAWFNWCKAFGVNLNSLAPAAVVSALQSNTGHNTPHTSATPNPMDKTLSAKSGFENILYSQLTKDSTSNCSPHSSFSVEQVSIEGNQNTDPTNKPEDLSAKSYKAKQTTNPVQSPIGDRLSANTINGDPIANSPVLDNESDCSRLPRNSVADCRDVLDNLLYKINNNTNAPSRMSDSEGSYLNEHNNANDCPHNNNTNKIDEKEWTKSANPDYENEMDADSKEAIRHGEKFLQWLENCSNPRVTAVQLMQLRFLISSVKDIDGTSLKNIGSPRLTNQLTSVDVDGSSDEGNRTKSRRRK